MIIPSDLLIIILIFVNVPPGTWPEELLLFERYIGDHGADDGYPLIVNDLHFWVEVGHSSPATRGYN